MDRVSALWKACTIAFLSSFCVMVIELIAARILAPHIGVSLYTWTSIIGVILAGIALGNYLGGRLVDKYTSPLLLLAVFFAGALATIFILPATQIVTSADWFGNLPIMLNFTLKTVFIFFLPAIILSMVSPIVIKLTLADLGQTGGIVGTIYACSTLGAILGTFMTGFYLILWLGTGMIVWLVAGVLIVTGIVAWFSWSIPDRWAHSKNNYIIWAAVILAVFVAVLLFCVRDSLHEKYTKESNYYTIDVADGAYNDRILYIDNLIHSVVYRDLPTHLYYNYLQTFDEIVAYITDTTKNTAPRVLHLGGGGYTFPRYMEIVYPDSVNEVVEIDPAVTQIAYEKLWLPRDTSIITINKDARLFFIQRETEEKYDFIIGDVYSSTSIPYHLTTVEYNELVKANLEPDGIYLVNVIENFNEGRFLPSLVRTLQETFEYVYLFYYPDTYQTLKHTTFEIVATDSYIDIEKYNEYHGGGDSQVGFPFDEAELAEYLAEKDPVLLTDDYVPTDILQAPTILYVTR